MKYVANSFQCFFFSFFYWSTQIVVNYNYKKDNIMSVKVITMSAVVKVIVASLRNTILLYINIIHKANITELYSVVSTQAQSRDAFCNCIFSQQLLSKYYLMVVVKSSRQSVTKCKRMYTDFFYSYILTMRFVMITTCNVDVSVDCKITSS